LIVVTDVELKELPGNNNQNLKLSKITISLCDKEEYDINISACVEVRRSIDKKPLFSFSPDFVKLPGLGKDIVLEKYGKVVEELTKCCHQFLIDTFKGILHEGQGQGQEENKAEKEKEYKEKKDNEKATSTAPNLGEILPSKLHSLFSASPVIGSARNPVIIRFKPC